MPYVIVAEWEDKTRVVVCPSEELLDNIYDTTDKAEDAMTLIFQEMAEAGLVGDDLPNLDAYRIKKVTI